MGNIKNWRDLQMKGTHRNLFEIFSIIIHVFVCVFPPEISLIFAKSFPFPSPYIKCWDVYLVCALSLSTICIKVRAFPSVLPKSVTSVFRKVYPWVLSKIQDSKFVQTLTYILIAALLASSRKHLIRF